MITGFKYCAKIIGKLEIHIFNCAEKIYYVKEKYS